MNIPIVSPSTTDPFKQSFQNKETNVLFFEDRSAQHDNDILERIVFGEEQDNLKDTQPQKEQEKKRSLKQIEQVEPVWVDEDDTNDALTVDISQQKRLRKLRKDRQENAVSVSEYEHKLRRLFIEKNPSALDWVQQEIEAEKEDQWQLEEPKEQHVSFKSNNDSSLVQEERKDGIRKPGRINLQRLGDANQKDPCQCTVFATEFHPGGRLLLVGGLDKRLRIFSVDGVVNPKVESIFYDKLPIRSAHFTTNGRRVLSAGRRRFLYEFDLVSGQSYQLLPFEAHSERSFEKFQVSWNGHQLAFLGDNGKIIVLDNKTKEEIMTLHASPSLHDVTFSPDGNHLLSCGENGMIHYFDLRMGGCIHKWMDTGASSLYCIQYSPLGDGFAVGNGDGILHLYQTSATDMPSLVKSFYHLTTPILDVCFHPDNQLLGFTSSILKNKVRLVHIPSRTIYANWPRPSHHLYRVQCMDMNEQYIALGNDHGRVALYGFT
eukprot:jgi/Galph1/4159/GphlegSOOS_G2845.1